MKAVNILIFLFVLPMTCDNYSVEKDMVQFDKGFIPLMYHTWQKNSYEAKKAVFYMDFQWQQFRNHYLSLTEKDEEWQAVLWQIDSWLKDAYESIDRNQPALAAIQLDNANYEMRALRQHYEMNYYLDYFYDFQDVIGQVNEVAEDEMMCLLEWNEFAALHEKAIKTWKVAQQQTPNKHIFELSNKQKRQINRQNQLIDHELNNLGQVMDCANRLAVLQASQQVEIALMNWFKIFGNFKASKVHYAIQ